MDIAENKKRIEQQIADNKSKPVSVDKGIVTIPRREMQGDFFDDGRVRPEINFSKYADRIFLAPQSKKLKGKRSVKWNQTLFDSIDTESHPAELLIEPLQDGKTGSTTTYKIWLGLIRLWELKGKPVDGRVVFSARELAEVLSMKWGGETAKRIRRELKTLKSVLYTWKWSFTDEEGKPLQLVDEMNILARSTYLDSDIRLNDQKFDALNVVEFDSLIVKNLLAGRTKPVELETFLSISNGAAVALYMRLDIILSGKNTYFERKAANLLADLEIIGARYSQRNHRKTKLLELVKALDGKELSTGKLSLSVVETNDKSDWKLQARRTPRKTKNHMPRHAANPKPLRDDLVQTILREVGETERTKLWESIAAHYPDTLIRQAVSEFKADRTDSVRSNGRFFVAIMHKIAHRNKLNWIKPCKSDCKFRPENQLIS